MSQCIFYSLFITFPKSRYIFNTDFKGNLLRLFGYIFNGHYIDKYSIDHWTLDLGKGNILTNVIEYSKDNSKITLK